MNKCKLTFNQFWNLKNVIKKKKKERKIFLYLLSVLLLAQGVLLCGGNIAHRDVVNPSIVEYN